MLKIFFFVLIVIFAAGCENADFPVVSFDTENVTECHVPESMVKPGLVAAITPFDDNRYFLADYGNVFLLDIRNGDLKYMIPPNLEGCSSQIWDATGIYYCPKSEKLFIANYYGNNIIVCKVDNERLNFLQEIYSKNTVAPEDVYYADNILVCANYHGDSATAFDLSSEMPREIWSTPGKGGHSVCIIDGKVYFTALYERKLYELDLKTGKVLRSIGKQSWNRKNAGFLWPTAVNPYDENHIIVSDAHTGYISIINIDTLKIERSFGDNGPTYKYLNMPYCTIHHNGKLLTVSTFQSRILVTRPEDFGVEKSFVFHKEGWSYLKEQNIKTASLRELWSGKYAYTFRKGPKITILGEKYYLGFGRLYSVKEKPLQKEIIFLAPPADSLYANSEQLYFGNLVKTERGSILFSSQARCAYYLSDGPVSYLIPFAIEFDSWAIDNQLYMPGKIYDTKQIEQEIQNAINLVEMKRLPNGLLPYEALASVFEFSKKSGKDGSGIFVSTMGAKEFENSFTSVAGKKFLNRYKVLHEASDSEEVRKAGEQYFAEESKECGIWEIILVHMLTGAK